MKLSAKTVSSVHLPLPSPCTSAGVASRAVDRPIRYAVNGEVHIAYQVVGEGPIDLVYTPGIWSNLEVMWEWPPWSRYLEYLAAFSRLVLFDMRGIGLSDRGSQPPILELQADDIRAVMDAAGCESTAVYGGARGAAAVMLFAATYPERVRALVLYAPVAKTVRSADWPYGKTNEEQQAFYERFTSEMGTGENPDLQGPSHDQHFKQWWARFERLVATPGAYRELAQIFAQLDIRDLRPTGHPPGAPFDPVADAGALSGGRSDRFGLTGPSRGRANPRCPLRRASGDRPHPVSRRLGGAGGRDRGVPHRRSPGAAARSRARDGDVHRHRRVDGEGHNARRSAVAGAVVRAQRRRPTPARCLSGNRARHGGRRVHGHLRRPARAISCARAVVDSARGLGLEVRVGIHTVECELADVGLAGIAVHIAARVASAAGAGEVLVSSTVKDLVAGSGIRFADLGARPLKGVPEEWHLYRVEG